MFVAEPRFLSWYCHTCYHIIGFAAAFQLDRIESSYRISRFKPLWLSLCVDGYWHSYFLISFIFIVLKQYSFCCSVSVASGKPIRNRPRNALFPKFALYLCRALHFYCRTSTSAGHTHTDRNSSWSVRKMGCLCSYLHSEYYCHSTWSYKAVEVHFWRYYHFITRSAPGSLTRPRQWLL